VLVRELGGANIASGIVGIGSILMPTFVLPSAISAGLFYAVAAMEHVRSTHRGANENIALVSDIYIAIILICFTVAALFHGLR
jgi:succinate dehydrogenase/fumarate reductase cytochrome b subunit